MCNCIILAYVVNRLDISTTHLEKPTVNLYKMAYFPRHLLQSAIVLHRQHQRHARRTITWSMWPSF